MGNKLSSQAIYQIIDYINKVEEDKFEKKNESEELFKFNRITV